MNGKQAKRIRRQAEDMTVGWEAVSYEPQHNHVPRRLIASTRAVYRNLKRRHNAARRIGR